MYCRHSTFLRLTVIYTTVIMNQPSIGFSRRSSNVETRGLRISGISDDVIQHFTRCPAFLHRFVTTCKMTSLSCKDNRCGNPMTGNMICSCEKFCLLRNDCCWDFQDQCPSLVEQITDETKKAFNSFNKTCENNFQIIEGTDAKNDSLGGSLMHNNFVVFDKGSGLSFRNKNVYKMHRETLIKYKMTAVPEQTISNSDNMIDQNLIAWNKLLWYNGSIPLGINDMKQIIEQGREIHGVEMSNIAPLFAEKCIQRVSFQCYNPFLDSEKCRNLTDLVVDKPAHHCRYFSSLPSELSNVECQAKVLDIERDKSDFAQLIEVSLGSDNVVKALNIGSDEHITWASVRIKNDPNTQQPEFSAYCGVGYKFMFSNCHRPTQLVTFLSAAKSNSSFGVNLFFYKIIQYLHQRGSMSISDISTTITNNRPGEIIYISVMELQIYLLNFRFENTSMRISDFLKEKYEGNEIQEMVSCLGFDVDDKKEPKYNAYPQNDNNFGESAEDDNARPEKQFLLCDYIIQNSTHTMKTFNVTGIEELLWETTGMPEDEGDTSDANEFKVKTVAIVIATIVTLLANCAIE